MKAELSDEVEAGRITKGKLGSSASLAPQGAFEFKTGNVKLTCVVTNQLEWDHISVVARFKSGKPRTPTWNEMCFIKHKFFDDDEVVYQYHPKKKDYVNCHPHCLHLWKKHDFEFPTPPTVLIGPHSARNTV